MYRPNFCADCGERVLRERWRPWTSNCFCLRCEKKFRRQLITPRAVLIGLLIVIALSAAYRAGRVANQSAPLIVERQAAAPNEFAGRLAATPSTNDTESREELAWICGARTKKGAPCSRRVRAQNERCWQHRGKRAQLAPKKLIAK